MLLNRALMAHAARLPSQDRGCPVIGDIIDYYNNTTRVYLAHRVHNTAVAVQWTAIGRRRHCVTAMRRTV